MVLPNVISTMHQPKSSFNGNETQARQPQTDPTGQTQQWPNNEEKQGQYSSSTHPTADQFQSLSGLGVDPYSSNEADYSINDIISGSSSGQPARNKRGSAPGERRLHQDMQGDTGVDPYDVGDVGDNRGSRTQEEAEE